MAETFERMPAVVAQARHQRQIETFKNERRARNAFIYHLVKGYGNEVRAMRRALSAEGYAFGQQTLRSYCRRLNLDIDIRDLWASLDVDTDGHVTLEELGVRHAIILASFQQWARKDPMLGSCAAIWESPEAASVARKRTGTWYRGKKMMASVFLETVQSLEWPLALDEKARTVLIGSLDLMDCGMVAREDLEWLDKWRPVEWVYAEPDPASLIQVKALLEERYGHPLRAWRCIMDEDDSNYVDWPEFKKACQKLKFKGNVAGAWRALDADLTGRITMKQFDEPSATLLASFKEWAEANFGSIAHCFKALDTDRSGALTFNEMRRACIKMHWAGNVRLLFDCLDADRVRDAKSDGKRSISAHELAFLDSWHHEIKEDDIKEVPPAEPKHRKTASAKAIADIVARLAGPSCALQIVPAESSADPAEHIKPTFPPVGRPMSKTRSAGVLDYKTPNNAPVFPLEQLRPAFPSVQQSAKPMSKWRSVGGLETIHVRDGSDVQHTVKISKRPPSVGLPQVWSDAARPNSRSHESGIVR